MTGKRLQFLRLGLLLLSAALMFGGIRNGEQETVLIKAVNICLECIGIG